MPPIAVELRHGDIGRQQRAIWSWTRLDAPSRPPIAPVLDWHTRRLPQGPRPATAPRMGGECYTTKHRPWRLRLRLPVAPGGRRSRRAIPLVSPAELDRASAL